MSEIKIHIFHIGKVCVAPELPFGGEHYSALKASGVLDRKSKRLWLPGRAAGFGLSHRVHARERSVRLRLAPRYEPARRL